MITTKYSATEMADLIELLVSPHTMKTRVQLLDLDHNYLEDLSDLFMGGQVNVDASAEITRSLDLTLFDPFKEIHLDPDSGSRLAIFPTNMIRIVIVIMNPARTKVYEIPVFTGPIDDVKRSDVFIDIKCLGKEVLALNGLWKSWTLKKGQEKTFAIKAVLANLLGETKFSITDRNEKFPNDIHQSRDKKPFLVLKKLAATMGMQLFYDGRGTCVLRRKPKNVAVTFTPRWLGDVPQVDYDLQNVVNAARVLGKKPKKGKKTPQARFVAPASHPLSPIRLGRGPANARVPRYLWAELQDDRLTSDKQCLDRAREMVNDGLMAGLDVAANIVPFFMLQEMDIFKINHPLIVAQTRAQKFGIPLVAGDYMTLGYLEKVRPRGGRPVKKKGSNK